MEGGGGEGDVGWVGGARGMGVEVSLMVLVHNRRLEEINDVDRSRFLMKRGYIDSTRGSRTSAARPVRFRDVPVDLASKAVTTGSQCSFATLLHPCNLAPSIWPL